MIAILMIASSILFLLYPFASKEKSTYFTKKIQSFLKELKREMHYLRGILSFSHLHLCKST